MKTNMHRIERVIRVLAGLVIASLAFWGPGSLWFLLGLIPLATGLINWCPAYALFGFSTCSAKHAPGKAA